MSRSLEDVTEAFVVRDNLSRGKLFLLATLVVLASRNLKLLHKGTRMADAIVLVTLAISGIAGLVGAGSPNFVAIATFCAFIGVGSGGNQPVDSAIFLEYIPATHQYLLVMESAFWSIGQAVAALIAW